MLTQEHCPHSLQTSDGSSLVLVVVDLLEGGVTCGIFRQIVADAIRRVLDQLCHVFPAVVMVFEPVPRH